MIHVYETAHRRNQIISRAFAQGCGGRIVPPAPLLPGDVFMYGCLRGLLPTLKRAIAEKRAWYYCDNAYFGRAKRPDDGGHFRVTRNALQHDGSGKASPERWRRLGLEIKPWRKTGAHVLICPPDEIFGRLWSLDVDAWLVNVVDRLRSATDRTIYVRPRGLIRQLEPFSEALKGAWALVTHQSNAAVDSLLGGVPVFCTGGCAAALMGTPELERIEEPRMPDDRERWAAVLAANQWTLEEMRDGTCWRELQVH